jgi:undecaprenyl-diphosphatase
MNEARGEALSRFERLLSFDLELLLLVQRRESARVTRLMRALTHLGDTPSWALLTAVLATSGGSGPRYAALLASAALLALALSQPLKRICCRPRPRTAADGGRGAPVRAHEDGDPDAFSFPSGHTAVAFAIAVALAGESAGLGPLVLGLAAGIGVSRVYLGAHYPLDVAAGALLGCGAGWAARLLLLAGSGIAPLFAALAGGG